MSINTEISESLNNLVGKTIIQSNVLIFDNVFKQTEVEAFLYLVEKWQDRFTESQTGDDHTRDLDKKKRDSLVLFEFEPIFTFIKSQLFRFAPLIEQNFNYSMDARKGFECQLTAHNDEHFYTAHTDFKANTATRVSLREITFVYYFHKQPKNFIGGNLFLWDHYNENTDPFERAPQGRYIEPINNRLVFFNSRYWHEVLPIKCPSGKFMDSRFTLNGWFHG